MMLAWILNKEENYETKRLQQCFADRDVISQVMIPSDFDIVVNHFYGKGIRYKGEQVDLPRACLVKTGSGTTNFHVALIKELESAGVPCINTADAVELAKNKMSTLQVLSKNSIDIPNTMLVRFPVELNLVKSEIGFPAVVKVITGSHGKGVYLCERQRDFHKLMEFIDSLGSRKTLIVQEYLADRPGEDLRVLVVGHKVLGAMLRRAPDGDFRANINNGGSGEHHEVTPDIERIALESAKVMGLDIAGVDLLFDSRGYRVCEVNSNPGFEGFEKYCQVDVASHIADYIKFRM
jgi:RimK family alpha-L-glutamate ligase